MKNTRDFYDKTANDWAERWYNNESYLPILKGFAGKLPSQARVLDLCCGAGYESSRMKTLGFEMVGLDISPKSIEIAKEKNPGLDFYVGDMLEDYSFVGPVQGIMVIAGLVHLAKDKLTTAFEKMDRVLEPEGHLLFSIRQGQGKIDEKSFVEIEGDLYDRDFYGHNLEDLIEASKDYFTYVDCLTEDFSNPWREYVFIKKS